MRVRLLIDLSDEARAHVAGAVLDLSVERAELWIRSGYAEALEAAELGGEAFEQATQPRAKKRG